MTLAPRLERHGRIIVVRDDLIAGGTKARVLPSLLLGGQEYVYASPAYGYAQVALAYSARMVGSRATVFTARRKVPHPRTLEAKAAGAKIVMVPNGYLTVVQYRAKSYCNATGAILLPFGFDSPKFIAGLTSVAVSIPESPTEVWTVAGSGTLSRSLQRAWPFARFHAVRVGREPSVGRAAIHVAPEPFERDSRLTPPFPSCSNYDAKAWQFIIQLASPGALFWNVAS